MTTPRRAPPDPRGATPGPTAVGDVLRYLAEVDEGVGSAGPAARFALPEVDGGPDDRTAALARLAALVAMRAAPASYGRGVDLALAAGATVDDVVSTLEATAQIVGLARVVSAAPGLARALGYDVDDALESVDVPRRADRAQEPSRSMGDVERR